MDEEYYYLEEENLVSYDPDLDYRDEFNPDDFEGDYWEAGDPDFERLENEFFYGSGY